MSRVAILGAGEMGSRMALNLLHADHSVVVYSRTPDKVTPLVNQGAVYAATPRDAAQQTDMVISMVTDDIASRSIWLTPETGAIAGLNETQIAIESSTLTVEWTKTLAAQIDRYGAAFLDAPVVGSRPQADASKLIYLVGGSAATLTRVQAVLLAAGGATIHHVGEVGQGMAMKLAVNALFGIQVAALAEMIAMLTKAGMTSTKAIEYLGELPVISPAAKNAGNLMLTHNHAPLFPIDLVEKDFRNIMQTAQAVDASIPVAVAVHGVYLEAITKGYGNNNITGVSQLYEL